MKETIRKRKLNSKILSFGITGLLTYFLVILITAFVPSSVLAQSGQIVPSCEGPTCNFASLMELIVNIVSWAINLGLIAVSGIFAWAGILYLTAQGDPGKIQRAHTVFTKVFGGAILALSAGVIIDLILTGLNVSGTVTSKISF